MEKLISVIVPVYNVEKYLSRCIESILRQTYPYFELILVDDGSPDKSGKICDKYAKKDERIKVLHKENGGVSSARNIGLNYAKGEYISFIDSDDWVRENYLEKLLAPMLQYDVQMVLGGVELRGIHIKKVQMKEQLFDIYFPTHEAMDTFFLKKQPLSKGPCCKLYKKIIIDNVPLRFNEEVAWGEDAIFLYNYWETGGKIYIIEDCLYYYNQLVFTSATRKVHPKKIDYRVALFKTFEKFINSSGLNDTYKNRLIMEFKIGNFIEGVRDICLNDERQIKNIQNFYNSLLPWDEDNIDNIDDIKHYQLVKEKRFEELCNIYKPRKQKLVRRILKKIYYGILYRLKIFKIERRRDGLKMHRKN